MAAAPQRGIWGRLAREVGSAPPRRVKPEPDPTEAEQRSMRCQRCGTYCPQCSAAPAGWGAVPRPARIDEGELRLMLRQLEPPPDDEARVRPVRRPRRPSAVPGQRIQPVRRPQRRGGQ